MGKEMCVALDKRNCKIYTEKGLLGLDFFFDTLRDHCPTKKIFLITDSNVSSLYGDALSRAFMKNGFHTHCCLVPAGEESKSLTVLAEIYGQMIGFGMTRADMVITLGGGVVGDLGGFAAATYQRGVPFIQIPTTLLAQVDSSVGGKVAVNLPQGKNMVGAFYQPTAVFIDPSVLTSLPDRYFRDGMAEVIKYGCIKDEGLLALLEELGCRECVMERIEDIICRCCDIKRELVERDELDRGERMLLNFGHTLGHAVESLSHYGYSHGEGVAIGMYSVTALGEEEGITRHGTAARIKKLLTSYKLPYKLPEMNLQELRQVIARDKKNLGGEVNLVLIERPGKAFIHKTGLAFLDNKFQV